MQPAEPTDTKTKASPPSCKSRDLTAPSLYEAICDLENLTAAIDLVTDALDEGGQMVDPAAHGRHCGRAVRAIRGGVEATLQKLLVVEGAMAAGGAA